MQVKQQVTGYRIVQSGAAAVDGGGNECGTARVAARRPGVAPVA
jgi:hypothetical protein